MSLLSRMLHLFQGKKTGIQNVDAVEDSDTKSFRGDLEIFNEKINSCEPFSLVRFGDGEMKIVQGESIDLSAKYNGEHRYIPGTPVDEQQRAVLADSLHYQSNRYFVGIACPCCVGKDNFQQLKDASNQSEAQLTWANIFVNANYKIFIEKTTPLFATRKIAFVCHEKADLSNLPFTVSRRYSTAGNAWINDHKRLSEELDDFFSSLVGEGNNESWLVLFCAGVLSNILVKEMTVKHPNHSYIDLGSVYDLKMGLGKTRKYLKGSKNLKKVCVWG